MEVPDEQDQEPVQMESPRFMAVVWGAGQGGDGPTTIVQLDGQGVAGVAVRLTLCFKGFLVSENPLFWVVSNSTNIHPEGGSPCSCCYVVQLKGSQIGVLLLVV